MATRSRRIEKWAAKLLFDPFVIGEVPDEIVSAVEARASQIASERLCAQAEEPDIAF